MPGISLVTKGMLAPVRLGSIESGGGGAGIVHKVEELQKPSILVKDVVIENVEKNMLTSESIKIKSLKIIVEQKD